MDAISAKNSIKKAPIGVTSDAIESHRDTPIIPANSTDMGAISAIAQSSTAMIPITTFGFVNLFFIPKSGRLNIIMSSGMTTLPAPNI